jgi:hypothetical protein
MGNVQSDGAGWCSPCSTGKCHDDPQGRGLEDDEQGPSPPSLCHAWPRADPTELFRGLAAAEEEERDTKARESDCVGDRAAPSPPHRPRTPPLLSDDLADVFPQARARAARRHLSGAASKSSSALSMQIALKVWTCAAG